MIRNGLKSQAAVTVAAALIVGFLVPVLALAKGPGGIHKDDGSIYLEMKAAEKGPGDYHNGDLLICSDCHVMHGSMQHNYQGTTAQEGNITAFPWNTTPNQGLLKFADPIDLCTSCHDGVSGIPDVIGGDVNGLAERSGGFFAEADVTNPRGHNLYRGVDTNPGFGLCLRCHPEYGGGGPGNLGVTCVDCHNKHGNGNPRNLQWASAPGRSVPLGLFIDGSATGMARYERSNVAYGTSNDVTLRAPTNMCIDCHHTFSRSVDVDPDGNGIHQKHPAYETEFGNANSIDQGLLKDPPTTNPVHWEAGTGPGFDGTIRVPFVNSGGTDFASSHVVDGSTNGVLCLSCHKAHGSASPFSLVWPVDGAIDNTGCDQCHLGEGR